MMRVLYFLRYCFIFTKALTLANYQVAKLVLAPRLAIRPGFLAVPMKCRTDFEVTSLANSITLTPGTISVHLDPDTVVIHCIDIGTDPDAVRRDVQENLEAPILKWTRPAGQSEGQP